jgi:hypothetical protein
MPMRRLSYALSAAACAFVVAACAHQGFTEGGIRGEVMRIMSPRANLKVVSVPSCAKGARTNEWQCRVRVRMRTTGEAFDLAVIASCAAKRCVLEHTTAWTGYAPTHVPWKAVINDWYDGGIDHPHSCAAVIAAISHLPMDGGVYSTVRPDLYAYERKVC